MGLGDGRGVETSEDSADLLTELQAEFDIARERPLAEGQAAAIQHIADVSGH